MCKENEGGKAFELMEGLVQEAAVLKSIFLLWDADVPLEEPGKGGKDGRVTLAELLGGAHLGGALKLPHSQLPGALSANQQQPTGAVQRGESQKPPQA